MVTLEAVLELCNTTVEFTDTAAVLVGNVSMEDVDRRARLVFKVMLGSWEAGVSFKELVKEGKTVPFCGVLVLLLNISVEF